MHGSVCQVEKESRSEQSVCLSRRMRRFVASVCEPPRETVTDEAYVLPGGKPSAWKRVLLKEGPVQQGAYVP